MVNKCASDNVSPQEEEGEDLSALEGAVGGAIQPVEQDLPPSPLGIPLPPIPGFFTSVFSTGSQETLYEDVEGHGEVGEYDETGRGTPPDEETLALRRRLELLESEVSRLEDYISSKRREKEERTRKKGHTRSRSEMKASDVKEAMAKHGETSGTHSCKLEHEKSKDNKEDTLRQIGKLLRSSFRLRRGSSKVNVGGTTTPVHGPEVGVSGTMTLGRRQCKKPKPDTVHRLGVDLSGTMTLGRGQHKKPKPDDSDWGIKSVPTSPTRLRPIKHRERDWFGSNKSPLSDTVSKTSQESNCSSSSSSLSSVSSILDLGSKLSSMSIGKESHHPETATPVVRRKTTLGASGTKQKKKGKEEDTTASMSATRSTRADVGSSRKHSTKSNKSSSGSSDSWPFSASVSSLGSAYASSLAGHSPSESATSYEVHGSSTSLARSSKSSKPSHKGSSPSSSEDKKRKKDALKAVREKDKLLSKGLTDFICKHSIVGGRHSLKCKKPSDSDNVIKCLIAMEMRLNAEFGDLTADLWHEFAALCRYILRRSIEKVEDGYLLECSTRLTEKAKALKVSDFSCHIVGRCSTELTLKLARSSYQGALISESDKGVICVQVRTEISEYIRKYLGMVRPLLSRIEAEIRGRLHDPTEVLILNLEDRIHELMLHDVSLRFHTPAEFSQGIDNRGNLMIAVSKAGTVTIKVDIIQ
ncbi:hypothetical protein [Candidatus Ichthyocystis sparus]|uniref:hypothetical protein n=1 Tax=Candidatus Ichthyocystis sparus TaxID=1561004 RepID=UPI000B82333D|nr:hypothetical protein [Candidatus Ichthyocystis sparus]